MSSEAIVQRAFKVMIVLVGSMVVSIPVLCVLVGQLLTRRLMSRGFRIWGFVAGLLVLMILFILGQYTLASIHRVAFGRIGPCSTCYEWSGIPFTFYWISWGLGVVLYLIISVNAAIRFSKITSQTSLGWLSNCWLWGSIFIILLGFVAVRYVYEYKQREDLRNKIAQVQHPILSGNFYEVDSFQLPQSKEYYFWGNISYVKSDGVKFSNDGHWMSLQYEDKLEIWRMPDLKLMTTFRSDSGFWESRITFSPDSSRLATWFDGDIAVYLLKINTLDLIWETKGKQYNPTDIAFGNDGRELVIVEASPQRQLVTLDVQTGNQIDKIAAPLQNSFLPYKLSPDSEYLLTSQDQIIQIHERHSGRLIRQIVISSERESGISWFLPNNDVLFWDCSQYKSNLSSMWNIRTGKAILIDINLGECGYPLFTATPDSRFAIFTSGQITAVWDLSNQMRIGLIPVQSAITALKITPDQRLLAIATADGRLHFFADQLSNR